MRNKFDSELEALKIELIKMGSVVENAISLAIEALIEKDVEKAKIIIGNDDEVDNLERDIERRCLKLLLQQQPVASDLRVISTTLKIITDIERIGDHATDISEIVLRMKDSKYIKKVEHIKQMATETRKMLNMAVDSFVKYDIVLAKEVIKNDDVVDNLFLEVRAELIDLIREDAANGEQSTDFLMIAKYFERIGDHAQNIAEWVIFCVTGKHKNESII